MEYRIFAQIPGVPLANEASREHLIGWLEHNHGDLGPVISWDDSTTARITVATDAEDASASPEVASDSMLDRAWEHGRRPSRGAGWLLHLLLLDP